jgi:hypothetical protein
MRRFLIAAAVMAGLSAGTAHAATVVHDRSHDIIPNYLDHHPGTPDPSLDITSFSVDLINGTFLLDAIFDGSIVDGPAAGDWVLGVDVGPGAIHPFGPIGAGNVTFDTAIVIGKTFQTMFNGHPLTAAIVKNNGVFNEFKLSFDSSFFPPGATVDPSHFGFNLWSRDGTGGINSIADFAPNNSTISAAPEPLSWALMIFGFGMSGACLRGRRKAAAAA